MQDVTAPVFAASERATSRGSANSTGNLFSILSISVFIFLATFWIAIAPVRSTRTLSMDVGFGSMAGLLVGAIFGIVGIVYRQKHGDRSTLVIGIIGLCVNGLCLLGMVLLVLVAALMTVMHLHHEKTTPQSSPSVVSSEQINNVQTNVNVVQSDVNITRIGSPQVIYQTRIASPIYIPTARAPMIPLQPLRPITPLRAMPVFIPVPMPIRHF